MFKLPKRSSTTLSIIATVVFMLMLVVCAVLLADYVDMVISKGTDNAGDILISRRASACIIIGYLIILVAAATDVILLLLLLRVRAGSVFTPLSVAYIRVISWLAMVIGALFFVLSKWFLISAAVGFAAFFVGLCLRVVKNVIEEATSIKGENDLTI